MGSRSKPTSACIVLSLLCSLTACEDGGLTRLGARIGPYAANIDFGSVEIGHSSERTFVIESTGSAPLGIRGLRVEGALFAVQNEMPGPVAPGSELVLGLTFTPTVAGTTSGRLVFETDDVPAVQVEFVGVGTAPPSCDDGNACTNDSFDADRSACSHEPIDGDCDDGSSCTTRDRCTNRVCVGEAVDCDDGNPCTQNYCHAATGCAFVADSTICDDGNPCTEDACDPQGGCSHENGREHAACGSSDCTTSHLCRAGHCEVVATPDGAPCTDDDRCTERDVCSRGQCVGTRQARPAELMSTLRSFGAPRSNAAFLSDGRLLVVDTNGHGVPAHASVLQVTTAGLNLLRQSVLTPIYDASWLLEVSPGRVLLIEDGYPDEWSEVDSSSLWYSRWHTLEIRPDGSTAEVAVDNIPAIGAYLLGPESTVFVAGRNGLCSVSADSATGLTFRGCTPLSGNRRFDLALAPSAPYLYVMGSDASPIQAYEITNPRTPAAVSGVPETAFQNDFGRVEWNADVLAILTDWHEFYGARIDVRTSQQALAAVIRPLGVDEVFEDIKLFERTLFVRVAYRSGMEGVLRVYDLTDPSHPRNRGDLAGCPGELLLSWTFGPTSEEAVLSRSPIGLASKELAARRNALWCPTSRISSGIYLDTPTGFRNLTRPGHGALGSLVQRSRTFAIQQNSVQEIDLTDPWWPRFSSGGRSEQGGEIFTLSPTEPWPVVVDHRPFWGLRSGVAKWVDVTQPGQAVVRDILSGPLHSHAAIVQRGQWLFALAGTDLLAGERLAIGVLDLSHLQPNGPPQAWNRSEVVDWDGFICGAPLFEASRSGDRIVAFTYFRDLGPLGAGLKVLDATDRQSPRLIATHQITEPMSTVFSAAIEGDRVIGILDHWGRGEQSLVLWQLNRGHLIENGLVALNSSTGRFDAILYFDGNRAVLAGGLHAHFYEVGTGTPRDIGGLDMPQVPQSALVRHDYMVFGGTSAVMTVAPPCAN